VCVGWDLNQQRERLDLLSAWQRRQGRVRREAEDRRRAKILPRLQLRRREIGFVGAVREMLRLEGEPLGLAIGRA
jgi:hypothetical protein